MVNPRKRTRRGRVQRAVGSEAQPKQRQRKPFKKTRQLPGAQAARIFDSRPIQDEETPDVAGD